MEIDNKGHILTCSHVVESSKNIIIDIPNISTEKIQCELIHIIPKFDIALLGCGAYGHMLTHKIHSELKKDAIYIGGPITNFFGILSTRELNHGMGKDIVLNEYWITTIPESFRPSNYKYIEDGCYW